MTDQDQPQSQAQSQAQGGKPTLAIGYTIIEAYRFLTRDWGRFFKVMWVPGLLMTLYTYYTTHLQMEWVRNVQEAVAAGQSAQSVTMGGMVEILYYPASFIITLAYALSALTLMRCILAGEAPRSPWGIAVDRRAFRFVLYLVAVVLIAAGPMAVAALFTTTVVAMISDTGNVRGPAAIPFVAVAFGIVAYGYVVFLRLSLVLCAVALDVDGGLKTLMKRSWNAVKGNTFRLFMVLFGIAVPVFIAFMLVGMISFQKLLFGGDAVGIAVVSAVMSAVNMLLLYMAIYAVSRTYQVLVLEPADHEPLVENA